MNIPWIKKGQKFMYGVLGIVIFGIIWFLATYGTKLGEILPNPVVVLEKFFASFLEPIGTQTMIFHILTSLRRMLLPYLTASALGVVLGMLMGWYRPVEAIIKPYIELIRPIPPIAWIPLSIAWFGFAEMSKYFLIFLACFPTITISTYSGVKSVDATIVRAAQMLGAKDQQLFTTVVMPSTVPYIFAGLQVAIGSSWATIVAAEMIRSSEGVGWLIISGQETSNMLQVLVGIVAIAITGLVLVSVMRLLETKLCAWNERGA